MTLSDLNLPQSTCVSDHLQVNQYSTQYNKKVKVNVSVNEQWMQFRDLLE